MSLEDLFGKLAMTTVNTVSRIAISHATNAAIVSKGHLLIPESINDIVHIDVSFFARQRSVATYISQQQKSGKNDKASRELETLQRQLDLKIKNLKVMSK